MKTTRIDRFEIEHGHLGAPHRGYQSTGYEDDRVEVTLHPRINHEERAKRKCYLTVFITGLLLIVTITFVANVSKGLIPSMHSDNAASATPTTAEPPDEINIDGTDITIGEMEDGNLEVATNEEEDQGNDLTNNHEEDSALPPPGEDAPTDPLAGFSCVDDRLSNGIPLQRGTYVCSTKNEYVFGILDGTEFMNDPNFGDFIRRHVPSGETKVYHSQDEPLEPFESFVLDANGTFSLLNPSGDTVWSLEPHPEKKHLGAVQFNEKCLELYDCPYLHLHSDGVIVLNWLEDHINPNDGQLEHNWNEENILHIYDFHFR